MAYPPRHLLPTEPYFVSSRTVDGQLLLRPSPGLNTQIGAILAAAQARYSIELFDFVFLSNHMHLALRSCEGKIPRFMQYLKSNIALAVNESLGRVGPVWQRRYSASPILDEGGEIDRARYMYGHGVKEGLVARAEQWPGIASVKERLSGLRPTYQRLDRRAFSRARSNRKQAPNPAEFTRPVRVTLSPWPFMKGMSTEDMRQRAIDLADEARELATEARRGAPPLGVKAVLAQDPHSRPQEALNRRPNPLCHARSRDVRQAYKEEFAAFLQDYRQASQRFRAGAATAPFPPYSFRPPLPLDWRPARGTGPPNTTVD